MKLLLISHLPKKLFTVTLLCGLCLSMASTALSTPLAPGTSMLVAGEPDPSGGVIIAPVLVSPFNAGTFSGVLTSTVILGDASNPFGPGLLTFTYQLSNDQTSSEPIGRLTLNDFTSFLIDASFRPGSGIPPTSVNLTTTGTVGFSFVPPPLGLTDLSPGATSALLVLQTSAPMWTPSFASVIDATVATSVATYAPATVPEPSSLAFLGLGLAALVARLARRRD